MEMDVKCQALPLPGSVSSPSVALTFENGGVRVSANSVSEFSVVFNFQSHEMQSKITVDRCGGCSGAACVTKAKGNDSDEPNQSDARESDARERGPSNVRDASIGHHVSDEQTASNACFDEEQEPEENDTGAKKVEETEADPSPIIDLSESVCSSVHRAQETTECRVVR